VYKIFNSNLKLIGKKRSIKHRSHASICGVSWTLAIFLFIIVIFLNPTEAESSSTDCSSSILIDLPPEKVFDVVASETFQAGLIYVPKSLEVSGPSNDPEVTLSDINDGNSVLTVNWRFGDIDNSANADIHIGFQVVVADV